MFGNYYIHVTIPDDLKIPKLNKSSTSQLIKYLLLYIEKNGINSFCTCTKITSFINS